MKTQFFSPSCAKALDWLCTDILILRRSFSVSRANSSEAPYNARLQKMMLRIIVLACAVSAYAFVAPVIAQTSEHNSDKITQPIPLDPTKCQQQGDKTFCPSFALTPPQFDAYQKKIGEEVKLTPPAVPQGIPLEKPCPSHCTETDGFCSCPYFIPPSVLGPAEFDALKEAAKVK